MHAQVLSVDDDPINQMVVENLLSPEGYKVCSHLLGIRKPTLLV